MVLTIAPVKKSLKK